MAEQPRRKIWTIGHSTRSADALLGLLRAHGIELLVDVRAHPGSRKYPQFNQSALDAFLKNAGIDYRHAEGLGGRRKGTGDSRNTAWRNASFRAYSDYMETSEFVEAAAELERLAGERRVAMMCSEAVWWRCHRSLISDWLKARGWEVLHIQEGGRAPEHPWTSAARVVEGRLSYREPDLFDEAASGEA